MIYFHGLNRDVLKRKRKWIKLILKKTLTLIYGVVHDMNEKTMDKLKEQDIVNEITLKALQDRH